MKKTKLLMPLTIVAAVSPVVALASCNKNPTTEGYDISVTGRANVEKYEVKDGDLLITLKAVKEDNLVIEVVNLKVGNTNVEINFDVKTQVLTIDKETLEKNPGKIYIEVLAGEPVIDVGETVWKEFAKYNESIYQNSDCEITKEDIKSVTIQQEGSQPQTLEIDTIQTGLQSFELGNGKSIRTTNLYFKGQLNPSFLPDSICIAGGKYSLQTDLTIESTGIFQYNLTDESVTYTAPSSTESFTIGNIKKIKINRYGYIEELTTSSSTTKIEYINPKPTVKSTQVVLKNSTGYEISSWHYNKNRDLLLLDDENYNFVVTIREKTVTNVEWTDLQAKVTINGGEEFIMQFNESNISESDATLTFKANEHPINVGDKITIEVVGK